MMFSEPTVCPPRVSLTPKAARELLQERLTPPSVLVIEGDSSLQSLFITLLRKSGFEVECVSDGLSGVAAMSRKQYAVILLDLVLPVLSGKAVLDCIAQEQHDQLSRIIVVTGVNQSLLEKVNWQPTFALVRKPFDAFELLQLVVTCAVQGRATESRG